MSLGCIGGGGSCYSLEGDRSITLLVCSLISSGMICFLTRLKITDRRGRGGDGGFGWLVFEYSLRY